MIRAFFLPQIQPIQFTHVRRGQDRGTRPTLSRVLSGGTILTRRTENIRHRPVALMRRLPTSTESGSDDLAGGLLHAARGATFGTRHTASANGYLPVPGYKVGVEDGVLILLEKGWRRCAGATESCKLPKYWHTCSR